MYACHGANSVGIRTPSTNDTIHIFKKRAENYNEHTWR